MRSVGCGLLLLAVLAFAAVSKAPASEPRLSLEEARAAAGCDVTPWVGSLGDIKAADPEQDAEKLIARGYFPLISARPPVRVVRLSEWRLPKAPEVAASGSARKPPEPNKSKIVKFPAQTELAGVHCLLPFPDTYVFQAPAFDDAKADDLTKWCGRAVVTLADDYAKRFNRRVVGDQGFPHRDVCAVAGQLNTAGRITDRPTPDLIPAEISDIAAAARFGLAARVAELIADGVDVGQRDVFGFDALKWSVVRDYRPVFDLLTGAGDTSDFCGALAAALTYERGAMITPLGGRCTSPEKRLKLLATAIKKGSSVQTVQALLDADPPPSVAGSVEVAEALSAAVLTDRADLVRLLLDWRAPKPEDAGEGWNSLRRSLLASALAEQRLAVAEFLLESGVDPGSRGLHWAVERKTGRVVSLLARHGADLNGGHPPQQLHNTAAADASLDPLGRRPPTHAIAGDERARRYVDPPIFLALDPLVDVAMVDLLLQLGADPNVRDSSGRTPLMVAITESRIYGQKDGVGWIEWYVPQRLIPGQEDWAHRGVEPVLALLAKGADVGLADPGGLTALHHAARSDYNVEIAQILLEHGADVNARDASGRTPLDHARAAKLVRMPEVLVAAGARSGSP